MQDNILHTVALCGELSWVRQDVFLSGHDRVM